MGMYGSRAVTLLVLISDDVINRILKLDIQTNILVYVTRCCTDLTSKVLKERTFGQSSAVLFTYSCGFTFNTSYKNGMIGHGGERCQNAQKQFLIKTY